LPLAASCRNQVFEEPRRVDIEAGERFVEDQQLGIMHQRCRNQHPLLHPLGVSRDRRVPPGFKAQQPSRLKALTVISRSQAAQAPDELQILHPGEVSVDMRLFRNITEFGAKSGEIFDDVFSLEEYLTVIRLQYSGDDLDRRGLPRSVSAEIANNLSGANAEVHVGDGGNAAVAS
jgi:hypothetical protein